MNKGSNLQYVEHLPEVGAPVLKRALELSIRISEAQQALAEALLDAQKFEIEITGPDKSSQWTKEEIEKAKLKVEGKQVTTKRNH